MFFHSRWLADGYTSRGEMESTLLAATFFGGQTTAFCLLKSFPCFPFSCGNSTIARDKYVLLKNNSEVAVMKRYSRICYAPLNAQLSRYRTAFAIKNSCGRHVVAHEKFPKELPAIVEFYAAEIDGLKEYRNGWAWGHCPFHADSNPSFTVNQDTGAFRCMSSSCGVSGSNIVSFVSQRDGLSSREARRFLEDWS